MRHGNFSFQIANFFNTPLRSYLWGMETEGGEVGKKRRKPDSDPTYEAWKPNIASTCPGLIGLLRSYLWGMETWDWWSWDSGRWAHSDPTYEAWKLVISTVSAFLTSPLRSYLWGMETHLFKFKSFMLDTTPILPMRHGNKHNHLPLSALEDTPILPMRHGNKHNHLPLSALEDTPILPMRHGNVRE